MNDKDKEAFVKFMGENLPLSYYDSYHCREKEAWQAACEYKENEYKNAKKFSEEEVLLAKLTIENAKLKKFISVLGHDDQIVDDAIAALEKLEKLEYE